MLLKLLLTCFVAHGMAGSLSSCSSQKPCISFTVEKVAVTSDKEYYCPGCGEYKVCLNRDISSRECKPSEAISHTCVAKGCANGDLSKAEDIGSSKSLAPYYGNPLSVGGWQCQFAGPGVTLRFLLKDGEKCTDSASGKATNDPSVTASCHPTDSASQTCTGNAIGTECVWEVTTPSSPDCNDNNKCTSDTCVNGECKHSNIVPTECFDGDACTNDLCTADTCSHPAINCDDSDACTDDSCDKATGCKHGKTNCDDSNACTDDSCDKAKGCQHSTTNCDDSDACTDDTCVKATGCKHTTTNCDDSDACTDDSCVKETGCKHSTTNCDDSDACTDDSCDKATGCKHSKTNCDDSDACTDDSCDKATGCKHSKTNCDDSNACTTDSCSATTGCKHDPMNCDDSDKCTTDSCSAGICSHSATVPAGCDDSDKCTNDGCLANTCINSKTPNAGCTTENQWTPATLPSPTDCATFNKAESLRIQYTSCKTTTGSSSVAELTTVCPPPSANTGLCPSVPSFPLYAGSGQTNQVGTVTVQWSSNNLVVIYETTGDYAIGQIHIQVTTDVSQLSNSPGLYPYQEVFPGNVKKATVTIDKSTLPACASDYFLAAHAVVATQCSSETAFPAGGASGRSGPIPDTKWWTYVVINDCYCLAPKAALGSEQTATSSETAGNNVVALGVMGAVIAVLSVVAIAGWLVAYQRRPVAETLFSVNPTHDPYAAAGPVASAVMSPGVVSPARRGFTLDSDEQVTAPSPAGRSLNY